MVASFPARPHVCRRMSTHCNCEVSFGRLMGTIFQSLDSTVTVVVARRAPYWSKLSCIYPTSHTFAYVSHLEVGTSCSVPHHYHLHSWAQRMDRKDCLHNRASLNYHSPCLTSLVQVVLSKRVTPRKASCYCCYF